MRPGDVFTVVNQFILHEPESMRDIAGVSQKSLVIVVACMDGRTILDGMFDGVSLVMIVSTSVTGWTLGPVLDNACLPVGPGGYTLTARCR